MTEPAAPIKLPETNCPACGVGVVAGSSRCPRCHSALPTASLAPRTRPVWLVAVLWTAAVGAMLTVLVLATSSGDEPPPPAGPAAAPPGAPGAPGTPVSSPAPTPEGALLGLARSAENRNLTASFEVRAGAPDHVTVISEQCGDARLQRLLNERTPALAGAGFTALTCVSADGTEQLSLSLR